MSDHDVATTKTPFQQGESVLSQRLLPRSVQFNFRHNGCSFSNAQVNRDTLIDFLRETRTSLYSPTPWQMIYRAVINGVYTTRALDVFLEEGASFAARPTDAWDQFGMSEVLSFTAYDPLWYDPKLVTFSLDTFTNHLTLPMTFPFTLCSCSGSGSITYTGQWETFPTIVIYGPARNVTIRNETTEKEINLVGDILYGNPVTITLSEMDKSAEDSCGNALNAYLSGDTDTFSIRSAPLVTGGINVISFYSEICGVDTQLDVNYYTRYRGI